MITGSGRWAPRTAGDPRDGELHQLFGPLPEHFDLESWDESVGVDVRYSRSDQPPAVADNRSTIWICEFRPDADV